MFWNHIRGLWNTYYCILAVVLTTAFWIYLAIFKYSNIHEFQFILYNLAAVAGLAVAAIRERGTAATMLAGGFVECHTRALKQAAYIGVAILVVLIAVDPPGSWVLKLALIFGFLLVIYVVFLVCHLFLPGRLADQLFSAAYKQRVLLIGPVEKARDIAKWIEATRFGIGFVTDKYSEEAGRVLHVTRVSDGSILERIIRHEGIKQIILGEIPLDRDALRLIVNVANKAGVCLHVFNNYDLKLISFRNQPLEDPIRRITKRMTDLVITLPIVLFILPTLSLVVKISQAIQSPGPLFVRETRSGLLNLPFRIFNFRTLRTTDSSVKQGTATQEQLYPMGSFLRKTHLDELPQFLNVFFGHMSVVGPQSYRAINNRRFSEITGKHHLRIFAKPGITGLAQINGHRGEPKSYADVLERVKHDIEYIENWSLPLDFWILLRTIPQIIKPPKWDTRCWIG